MIIKPMKMINENLNIIDVTPEFSSKIDSIIGGYKSSDGGLNGKFMNEMINGFTSLNHVKYGVGESTINDLTYLANIAWNYKHKMGFVKLLGESFYFDSEVIALDLLMKYDSLNAPIAEEIKIKLESKRA